MQRVDGVVSSTARKRSILRVQTAETSRLISSMFIGLPLWMGGCFV